MGLGVQRLLGTAGFRTTKAYVGEAVRPCGLRRLRDATALRLFRDAYKNYSGLQTRNAHPHPSIHY